MSWQKCPICEGFGHVPMPLSMAGLQICTVCGGKKIIHEVTGKPPTGEEPEQKTTPYPQVDPIEQEQLVKAIWIKAIWKSVKLG